jgi:omega-amidase
MIPLASESDTVRMLSSVAKETGTWLVGGMHTHMFHGVNCRRSESREQDLYPRERYPRATSTTPLPCIHRKVRVHPSCCLVDAANPMIGELVALHRKIHLFDIDIPGKITFKVGRHHGYRFSCRLILPRPIPGKRNIDGRRFAQLL